MNLNGYVIFDCVNTTIKPFSNCVQFCQFPARFLQLESFAFCRIIRFFLVNTKSFECLRVAGVHAHWKHFVEARLSGTASRLSLQSRGQWHEGNDTLYTQWNHSNQIDIITYLQIKRAKHVKKQILNHIHIIITLIKIQMDKMHKVVTERKFQGELQCKCIIKYKL